jgi:hypothetical protein
MEVNGMLNFIPVGGMPGILSVSSASCFEEQFEHLQPINLFVMCELENKLVTNPIDANGPAYKFKLSIVRIIPDEVVSIKVGEIRPPNPACHLISY